MQYSLTISERGKYFSRLDNLLTPSWEDTDTSGRGEGRERERRKMGGIARKGDVGMSKEGVKRQ